MNLKINKIENHTEIFYADGFETAAIITPTHTGIDFTLDCNGKVVDMKLKVKQEDVQRYGSVPDYESTVWEFLRELLKGLGE